MHIAGVSANINHCSLHIEAKAQSAVSTSLLQRARPWTQVHEQKHRAYSAQSVKRQRCSHLQHGCHATLQIDRPTEHSSKGAETETTSTDSNQKFSWTKQWYPVSIVEDLETYKPNAIKLLGKNLVLWRDNDEQWRCFDDVCPHRLVPLSEGRIETDGTLQCAYHGWRFNTEGTCTTVPQAENSDREQKAAGHPRACVPSYPVQVQHHLLWVWADASPNAQLECLSKQPAVIEELQEEDKVIYMHPWFVRDMPFGQDILLENVLDPSHVPFSHHGVIGNRNKVLPSTMHLLEPEESNTGFTLGVAVNKNGTNRAQQGTGQMTKLTFEPPTLVKYKFGGPGMQMITYCTPTSPGRSRLFYCLVADKDKAPKAMKRAIALRPKWLLFLSHFQRNLVLDGDSVFLHGQDCHLHQEGSGHKYYMPTSMDTGINSLRKWLSALAGPIPWASQGEADVWTKEYTRSEMLDRYNQHTKHCKHCSKALTVITWLQRVAFAAVAVASLVAAAAIGAGRSPVACAAVGAGALAAAVVAWRLGQVRQKFMFVDYVQADH